MASGPLKTKRKSEKCGKVEIIEICNIRTWLATTGLKMELAGGEAGHDVRKAGGN